MEVHRILFIDDDVVRMQSYVDWLRVFGFEVEVASDIDQAFDKLAIHKDNFDLIILDIMLPYRCIKDNTLETEDYKRKEGIWLLRKLREDHPRIKVIIYSARTEASLGVDWKNLGAMDYIEKPAKPAELVAAVEEALKQRKESK